MDNAVLSETEQLDPAQGQIQEFKRGGGGGGVRQNFLQKGGGGGVQPLTREQFILQIKQNLLKRGGGGGGGVWTPPPPLDLPLQPLKFATLAVLHYGLHALCGLLVYPVGLFSLIPCMLSSHTLSVLQAMNAYSIYACDDHWVDQCA